jgi:hypothetical protein
MMEIMPTAENMESRGRKPLVTYPSIEDKDRIQAAAERLHPPMKMAPYVLQAAMERVIREERAAGITAPGPSAPVCAHCGGAVTIGNATRARREHRPPYCRTCQRTYGSKELKDGYGSKNRRRPQGMIQGRR